MKILLVAVNAKYIHSNPAVYSLKAYAEAGFVGSSIAEGNEQIEPICDLTVCPQYGTRIKSTNRPINNSCQKNDLKIEIAEYTINNRSEACLADIYKRQPDIVAFSCYIWNWSFIKSILQDIKKILPGIAVWLGGPEVSFHAENTLEKLPMVEGIIIGEGEGTFRDLCEFYRRFPTTEYNHDSKQEPPVSLLSSTPGLCIRQNGKPYFTGIREPINLDDMPFWYEDYFPSIYPGLNQNAFSCRKNTAEFSNPNTFKNRIIYYESSRGCPFSCSYCLSSVDTSVRYRSLHLVLPELQFFIDRKVPQVKFIDRTFNCNHKRTEEIWKYISENDNGITNFHFEISADLLTDREIELLSKMRPGLVQLEIGVQTSNPDSLKAVHRKTDLLDLKKKIAEIKSPQNVHIHLDLIAGLPYEDFESFKKSFMYVFLMAPDQLQLGFLKVLKGSPIEGEADDYGIEYMEEPPYEVLSTRYISFNELLRLKAAEDMLEIFYNSHQFEKTIDYLLKFFENPFDLFDGLALFYEKKGYNINTPSRMGRFGILLDFAICLDPEHSGICKELLTYDAYSRENCKSRPAFAVDLSKYNAVIYPMQKGKKVHVDVFNYSVWKGTGAEKLECPVLVEFNYEHVNPLNNNCHARILPDTDNC